MGWGESVYRLKSWNAATFSLSLACQVGAQMKTSAGPTCVWLAGCTLTKAGTQRLDGFQWKPLTRHLLVNLEKMGFREKLDFLTPYGN